MESIVYCSVYQGEIGKILITANQTHVLGVEFVDEDYDVNENEITIYVKEEITQYLAGKIKYFSFYEFSLSGFQAKVLEAVSKIPYGKCMTYRQIAKKIGYIKSVHAVISAIATNPYVILIPCHRVVSSDGKLHGCQGRIDKQRYLLLLEHRLKDVNIM